MSRVYILAGIVFCLGVTTNVSLILSFTVFLNILGADHVPFYYMALNLISIWTGLIFFWKNPNGIRWLYIMCFMVCALFALILPYKSLEDPGLIYGIYIGCGLFNIYAYILFWNLVNSQLSIRELKKSLGILSSSGSVAAICSGIMLQPCLQVLTIPKCFTICIISTFIIILLLSALKTGPASSNVHSPRLPANVLGMARHELLRLATLFIFLGAIIRFFVDYSYATSLEQIFTSKKEIASFVGWFSSLTRLAVFIWQLLCSQAVLRRFRLQTVLCVLPAASSLLALLCLLFPNPYISIGFQFAFLFLLNSLSQPAINVLLGAMDESIKSRARYLTEGIVYCCAVLVSGLIILAVKSHMQSATMLMILVLLGSLLWMWLLHYVNDAYAESIRQSLFDDEEAVREVSSEELIQDILSDDRNKKRSALQRLENMEKRLAEQTIHSMLRQMENTQSMGVLVKLICRTRREEPWLDSILTRLKDDEDPRTRANLIEALAYTQNPRYLPYVFPYISSAHNRVRANAILFAIKIANEEQMIREAMLELMQMLHSAQGRMRSSGLAVIGELGLECFAGSLQHYLTDPDLEVRRSALNAVFKIPGGNLVPTLEAMLNDDSNTPLRPLIERAVSELGERVFDDVEGTLKKFPIPLKEKALSCIRSLRKIESIRLGMRALLQIPRPDLAVCFLELLYDYGQKKDLKRVLEQTLALGEFDLGPVLRTYILGIELTTETRSILIRVAALTDKSHLIGPLERELEGLDAASDNETLERAFFACGLAGPGADFTRQLLLALRRNQAREYDLSLELVELKISDQRLRLAILGCMERLRMSFANKT